VNAVPNDWPFPPPPPAWPGAAPAPGPEYVVGLDLGQSADYSALAVLTRTVPQGGGEAAYTVGHLHRWPLGTDYPAIVADVAALVGRPPLDHPVVCIDEAGVGKAVLDLFRREQRLSARLVPFLVTGGRAATSAAGGGWHLPKVQLVSTLQALLQSGRLRLAAVPGRELLVKELLAFRVKLTAAGNETFEAWRERDHDDLVFAVAMAV
jgi:hypothetical protein